MNADVIIPCTVQNHATWYMAEIAIRSCRYSTAARVHALCNNSKDSRYLPIFERHCAALGVHYEYCEGPFNMNRLYNRGLDLAEGDYVACCNQDLLFFPDWFEEVVKMWEANPRFFYMLTYSFGLGAATYWRAHPKPENRIELATSPTSGLTVLKAANGYRWDEQFPDWEQDADFTLYCQKNNLIGGQCLNARVDHLCECVRAAVDMDASTGIENHCAAAAAALKKKWGHH